MLIVLPSSAQGLAKLVCPSAVLKGVKSIMLNPLEV